MRIWSQWASVWSCLVTGPLLVMLEWIFYYLFRSAGHYRHLHCWWWFAIAQARRKDKIIEIGLSTEPNHAICRNADWPRSISLRRNGSICNEFHFLFAVLLVIVATYIVNFVQPTESLLMKQQRAAVRAMRSCFPMVSYGTIHWPSPHRANCHYRIYGLHCRDTMRKPTNQWFIASALPVTFYASRWLFFFSSIYFFICFDVQRNSGAYIKRSNRAHCGQTRRLSELHIDASEQTPLAQMTCSTGNPPGFVIDFSVFFSIFYVCYLFVLTRAT